MQGILLVGHGTRDAEGVSEFFALASLVARARPAVAVESSFLEIADPPITTGIERLAARGVDSLVVMPLLLFAAGHAKQDVPRAIANALSEFPSVRWTIASHLGCHSAILEQSAQCFAEANHDRPAVPREQTVLIFVGRGSHDDEATREMHRFATLASQRASVATIEVCFVAMAQPSLTETLERIAKARFRRVIVQPHLLFSGELLAGIREMVAAFAAKHSETEWLLAERLGPTPLVSRAILERIDQAGASHFPSVARAQVSAATTLK